MFEKVKKLRSSLQAIVKDLDPEVMESRSAIALVEDFAAIEHLAAAGKALAAKRVAESGAWRSNGHRTAAHWMALKTGTSVGSAVQVLETASRLSELPKTDNAVRAGKLSEAQAREIVSAAAASPSSEGELLKVAKREGMATLKESCARVKAAAAADECEPYGRIHKRRRLRNWTDHDGAFHLEAILTPDCGAKVLAALEPYRERIFQEARKQGRREPSEAYGADALVAMAQDRRNGVASKGRNDPGALVHVFVDHKALVRGHTKGGEMCEISGVGPVPVATARALADDAYLRVLVTDGTDIRAVSNLGRTIPTRLKTAVIARDRKCRVWGCEARDHLQIDHIVQVTDHGPNSLANLWRLCPHHHYLKTYKAYRVVGEPGARSLVPPGEPIQEREAEVAVGSARGP
ncbi:MAG: DUF222 domain-containing protein [Actinomycetota bacterium]